jgi:hypothetical protein
MRVFLTVIGLALALVVPALPAPALAAPVFDTPKALLDYAYKPYATDNFSDDAKDDGENPVLYSHALNAAIAEAAAATNEDEVGPIDFDVFINGQDYELHDLKIGEPKPVGQGADVPVTFRNFEDPQSLVFHMVKEDGGWKINDIDALTDGNSWNFMQLLTTPPDEDSTD